MSSLARLLLWHGTVSMRISGRSVSSPDSIAAITVRMSPWLGTCGKAVSSSAAISVSTSQQPMKSKGMFMRSVACMHDPIPAHTEYAVALLLRFSSVTSALIACRCLRLAGAVDLWYSAESMNCRLPASSTVYFSLASSPSSGQYVSNCGARESQSAQPFSQPAHQTSL